MRALRAALETARVRTDILLWRHGWCWPLALLAVIAGGVLQLAWVQPERAALAARDPARAHQRALPAPRAVEASPSGSSRSIHAAIQESPAADVLVARLLTLSQAQGITWPRSDYLQQVHPVLPLIQLRVTQPVRTTYPQLRRYIESVLREVPTASLDRIAAQRGTVEDSELEIRLEWSFWLPATSGAAR